MVVVVSWKHFEKRIEGTVVKQVVCEKCSTTYFYSMARSGVGQGRSFFGANDAGAIREAGTDAERCLEWILSIDCDPVACPRCGWFQAKMVSKLRQAKYKWMDWLVGGIPVVLYGAGVVTVIAMGFNLDNNPLPVVVAAIPPTIAGVGIALFRRRLRAGYDPNWRFPIRPDPVPGAPRAALRVAELSSGDKGMA